MVSTEAKAVVNSASDATMEPELEAKTTAMTPTPTTTTTTTTTTLSSSSSPSSSSKENFIHAFDDVIKLLMEDIETTFDLPPDTVQYLRKVLTYNVPHGKLNRGLAVFHCYKAFRPGEAISADDERRAHLLGWCVELLQAFFLVADDIMDDSHTRRGQPCFYRLPEIGLKAVNDSLILEMMVYRLLRAEFGEDDVYPHLVNLFRDMSYTTEIGQLLDLTNQHSGSVDLTRFTDDALARIYKYKTSHYTFYLPVALGMRLADVTDQKAYQTANRVCLKLGHYFQAQDDILDAFGDPAVTGKVGTDIEENTCTWLIVEAMKRASPEDRAVLQHNYGRKEKECVQRVKDLYLKLGLPQVFAKFEQESYTALRQLIDGIDHMPVGAFEFLLSKIYKRDK